MNNSIDRILDGILVTLKTEVLTRLTDEYARGQVLSAIDLLANLKPRIDWAMGPLREEVEAQSALAARIAERFAAGPERPPAPPAAAAEPGATASDVERLRDRLDEHLCEVIRWLAARDALPAAAECELEIRRHLRERLRRELGRTAKTLLGEISRGAQK